MRRVMLALAGTLVAALSLAQETPGYTAADNPFQNDYEFALGKPIRLRAIVEGVRLDTLNTVALTEVRPGEKVRCEVELAGTNEADRKATITVILLLEDDAGKGLERIALDPFKLKSARPFNEKQRVSIGGDTLRAAVKIYVFIQVEF